jgi:ribosome recycling factor
MSNFLDESKKDFEKIRSHFISELAPLRTGQATPALLDHVQVEVYGVRTPLQQLASISVPDARTLVIEPWDKNSLKEIEKGIIASDLGLSPVVDGERVRISIPSMTEDTRKQLVKTLREKLEEARISLRHMRDQIKDGIVKQEREKLISEDDKYRQQRDLDEYIQGKQKSFEDIAAEKEKEIMTI